MKKLFLLLLPALLLTTHTSIADDDRYQAVILQQSGGTEGQGKIFILDSEKGHMWLWEDKSKYTTKEGKVGFGTKTSYQGKLKPGVNVGDVVVHGMER